MTGRVSYVSTNKQRKKIKVKWWHIVLIAVFVVLFLFLAWWQWTRFQSGSGTFQNLGYAFQWPLFAVFVIYAYRTAMRYENERIDFENAAEENEDNAGYQAEESATKIDEDFLPQRPQIDVETYNELNRPRRRHHED